MSVSICYNGGPLCIQSPEHTLTLSWGTLHLSSGEWKIQTWQFTSKSIIQHVFNFIIHGFWSSCNAPMIYCLLLSVKQQLFSLNLWSFHNLSKYLQNKNLQNCILEMSEVNSCQLEIHRSDFVTDYWPETQWKCLAIFYLSLWDCS